ncbi:acetyl-CoA carboxylase carboxyltransferase subunit alpha [Salinibacter ruber]|jgi:acetyl-CoA carboxylase carboxyl transferase subunit alpha|uniref:Acetyl-coenzyme A carboxylase carboxyl transferase subunit alpha n=2 Tax=Salinibacter ruber TaxID=146919 RepID=A0A9X2TR12_9BACT|nr:acetyl-CoA carboxylase carboxyltransferase subunit alpha [Salinibacter ruber]MCS3637643.1 acetyl-CoA carboxylase carboxyl transferase subunit alpha [Salinibacter ruber]MCS3639540.1 acetyl-CoA carboxylase carboxyl transferase subunit alpha [Salinibacter ruber]MCS3677690.1 acetyl-CoA carboxylase carboxyl transferase subunit alpha [Salinibacter ruber]MCS3680817.1 acetyl-CoA carboxylase carboxyl transferase subunit alpha [Salinibacter ruber]MCS3704860.1 acetyl-CoA carboxylase carboxyl transfera
MADDEHLLDFEKPLVELEDKLTEMRELNAETQDDLSNEIEALEERVEQLRTSIYRNLTRWQRVQIARHPERPYTLDHIEALTEDFTELRGDRKFGDDRSIVGGLAQFTGSRFGYRDRTVMIMGHQKGRDTKERKYRRFGMPNPEGYRKAERLMKMAAKFGKPVVVLLDTPGAYPGMGAEERGQAEAIAHNLFEMARLETPVVIVVIGEGASGGALGVGLGDRILMLENAWYSVIAPESCSQILWRSWDHKEDAAQALKLTATDLTEVGIVDEIVPEPVGGAHRDPQRTYQAVGAAVADALDELEGLDPQALLDQRLEKFDALGAYESAEPMTASA